MKRFYKDVGVAEVTGGWHVALDRRGVKSQGGRAQVVPSRALADLLAAEWAAQGDEIDPAAFVYRDMADFALDVIGPDRDATIEALLRFAEGDTLCYRADAGEPLQDRQLELWEPVLKAAEARYDVHFERIDGIMARPQPAATLARLRAVLAAKDNFALSALNTLASLSASLTVALAALEPEANAEALWAVANLEEDWQANLWGKDWEAEQKRAQRAATFAQAMAFARAASDQGADRR
ncbi:chaperone required for assembly of F1-ATPase [Novosphingobium kunmingense]|uniref:Chaperone required for assembly of F1-ATPase n=1 Tax=Novosphingobium kunmingense TaxID=1211806 RepID=A0A2N0HKK3_9SPHN|nr:ATP12 family protein [Novosphingobium kunmingense]PKB19483.1 chaperone required for assembly of F1-ATPase [Novosphingobium kunmingense]